jgi:hypothetical protein
MSHFAQIDENNAVIHVIVVEQDVITSGIFGPPSSWIQTSYNTRAGVHLLGGTPLRKNYAGIGFVYDAQRDAFIPPKPYASWILNETSCQWEAPTPRPTDENKIFIWNEENQAWQETEAPVLPTAV